MKILSDSLRLWPLEVRSAQFESGVMMFIYESDSLNSCCQSPAKLSYPAVSSSEAHECHQDTEAELRAEICVTRN